jgi:hypothetical protein
MKDIAQLLNSSADLTNQTSRAKLLAKKWEKTGLLEGLDDERSRNGISVLLENQARQLLRESSQIGSTEGSEEWAGVALPLVRRIFGEISAKEFVSVQPMNLPSGLVFYLDFKYGTNQPGFASGSDKTSRAAFQADSVFGVTETSGTPTGGLYGQGKFAYSINDTQSVALASASSLSATEFVTGAVSATDYNFDTRWSASYAGAFDAGELIHTLTVSASALPNGDPEGVRAFQPVAAGIVDHFPEFTRLSSDKQQITFVVSASAALAAGVKVNYHKQPGQNLTAENRLVTDRGDFEYRGQDLDIPELNIEMRSEVIAAKTRKLKAVWTPEMAQDLNAYHSIDAEGEVTSMLSEYISHEIDLELLDMLVQGALTKEYWSAKIGSYWNGTGFTQASAADAAQAYDQGKWFQTLGTKIQKVSNEIHRKTMRGGANFLVCSPEVATILESIPGYAANTNGDSMKFAMGVQKVGMINNRYEVYKNPYFNTNRILLGYSGSQFLETGAVFAPYIPLMMTPLIWDPTNFVPRKAIMTRYAKKMVRPEFYGIIDVANLEAV